MPGEASIANHLRLNAIRWQAAVSVLAVPGLARLAAAGHPLSDVSFLKLSPVFALFFILLQGMDKAS